jgi:hypothetical protein
MNVGRDGQAIAQPRTGDDAGDGAIHARLPCSLGSGKMPSASMAADREGNVRANARPHDERRGSSFRFRAHVGDTVARAARKPARPGGGQVDVSRLRPERQFYPSVHQLRRHARGGLRQITILPERENDKLQTLTAELARLRGEARSAVELELDFLEELLAQRERALFGPSSERRPRPI